MRIGVTGGLKEWRAAARSGYDYFEANLASVAAMDGREFSEMKKLPHETGIYAEAFNGFLSGSVRLYECADEWLKDYCDRAYERAAELGGRISVIGSGRSRSVPDGMPFSDAEKRFAEILNIIGDSAERYGMRAVIEPLNREECNFINTVDEGAAMCRRTGHRSVGLLVDFYHFYMNGESLDELGRAADILWHAHIARPNRDRRAPEDEDVPLIRPYAEALKSIGYGGRISLECSWRTDIETCAGEALHLMRDFK